MKSKYEILNEQSIKYSGIDYIDQDHAIIAMMNYKEELFAEVTKLIENLRISSPTSLGNSFNEGLDKSLEIIEKVKFFN